MQSHNERSHLSSSSPLRGIIAVDSSRHFRCGWRYIRTVAYTIEYSPETDGHLRILTARQRRLVFDTVDRQLAHQSLIETRNRKPMRPNPVAP